MSSMTARRRAKGFTAVELVVVIGLLVVITGVVAVIYTNAANQARANALRNDLKAASSQLEAYRNFENQYPPTPNLANGGKGLPKGDTTTYTYLYDAPTDRYCLTANSTSSGIAAYHISSEDTDPQEGACTPF